MKKTFLFILATLLSVLAVSCGNNNVKKGDAASQPVEVETVASAPEALDPYTCLLYYFGYFRSADYPESYGYVFSGNYSDWTGGNDYIILKNCSYDRDSRQYLGIGDGSAGVCITSYAGNHSLWQFTKSVTDRDAIFEKLVRAGFEKESLGNNMYHFSNGMLGIDCQLENDVWIFRTAMSGEEDYPFIEARTCDDYKELISNQVKFEKDFKGKRFKIKGKVTRIGEDAFNSNLVEYSFAESWLFSVRVPSNEAFYNLNLPAELTISGIVKSASSATLDLADVYFYDSNRKEYLGYNRPRYQTETRLNAPKVYEKNAADGVTKDPKVKEHGDSGLKVTRVTLTDEETILDFTSDATVPGSNAYNEWCCIDPDAYIIAGGQRYKLTRAEGIEKAPGKTNYPKLTMSLDFRLHFPAIPKSTATIDFSETGDSSWWIKGIELNVPQNNQEADYEFTGYLTNGSARYNIEMKLYCVEGYQYEGYYRYLSQPKDKRIPVEGEIGFETGDFANSESFYLYSSERTELFEFSIEGKNASGTWKKYESAADCELGGDNYTKRLQLQMTRK